MRYETVELIGKYKETIILQDEGERTSVQIISSDGMSMSTGSLEMSLNGAKQHMINQGCREIKNYDRREIFRRAWQLIKKGGADKLPRRAKERSKIWRAS